MIKNVHDQPVSHQKTDGCPHGSAHSAPFGSQRNADGNVADGDDQINNGPELMLVQRPLHLDPHILDQRNQKGDHQKQRGFISPLIFISRIDIQNKVSAKDDEATGQQAKDQPLDTPDPGHQSCKLRFVFISFFRRNAIHSGRKHRGDGGGKCDKQTIELCRHTIHRNFRRPAGMGKDQLVHIPVDLIDHHIDQQERAEYGDLL